MFGGFTRSRIATTAKICPSILAMPPRARCDTRPHCLQMAARNLSSKSKVPLISTRQFRSNASGRAAVTDLPMFDDGPVPEPYIPQETAKVPGLPVYDSTISERRPYWQKIPRWKDVTEAKFLTYTFHVSFPVLNHSRVNLLISLCSQVIL